ncbi:ABC transporter permease [Pasteuria penetrans]|uniref:ABC transporter permease n=1 Tax=Pasteuria penetrans TaxID=86005 RepID=UPI000FBC114A|nr:ABC transporter permease [Pasteuria penetrans]
MTIVSYVFRMVQRKPQAYLGLFINEFIKFSFIFAYDTLFFHPQWQIVPGWEKYIPVLLSFMVASGFGFSIYYSLATLYTGQRRQFGILLSLGMDKRIFNIILFSKVMIIDLCAFMLGIPAGLALGFGLLFFVGHSLEYVDLYPYFSFEALEISVFSALGSFFMAVVAMPFFMKDKVLIGLLRNERGLGNRSGNSLWILYVIFLFFSLGVLVPICFFLPVDWGLNLYVPVQLPLMPVPLFIPMSVVVSGFVILPILCMGLGQCFYRQIIFLFIILLRWNRDFSWKGIRLLWIGNLVHRLHDNVRFFRSFSMALVPLLVLGSFLGILILLPIDRMVGDVGGSESRVTPIFIYRLGGGDRVDSNTWRNLNFVHRTLLSNGLTRIDSYPLVMGPTPTKDRGEYISIYDKQKRNRENTQDGSVGNKEGLFISYRDYKKILDLSGHDVPTLDPDEIAVLCARGDCPASGSLSYSVLEEFGVRGMQYWDSAKSIVSFRDFFPRQWVLGDRVYARALEHRGVRKLWDVNYVLPKNGMNTQIFEALFRVGSMDLGGGGRGNMGFPDSFIYNGVVDSYTPLLSGIFYLVIFLLCSLIMAVNAGSMLFLRMYNDGESQRRQFHNLLRIGFPVHYLRKSVTVQVALIFFIPVLFAVLLSVCEIYYGVRVAKYFSHGVGEEVTEILFAVGWSIVTILFLQVAMFFPMRLWVLRKLEG